MPQLEEPQAQVAGFRLLEKIAHGGMGSVWRAHQISMDRHVALKLLGAKYIEDQVFRERFLKEARSAARLNHPNIVQAIDAGEADGHFYFAMEFVEGRTLAALIRERGRLEPLEACGILAQIARALEHAHRFDMVHLDVKPGNIMVTGAGMAKLADFGLARHVEDEDVLYTQKRVIFGTPHYMAPEQTHSGGVVDIRCDIYALGVTFYEAITGKNPFSAPTTKEILAKVREGNVPPAREMAPETPEEVSNVIAKMMAMEPDNRYRDPSELLLDLDALIRGRPPPVLLNLPRERSGPPQEARTGRAIYVIIAASIVALFFTVALLAVIAMRGNRISWNGRRRPTTTTLPQYELPETDPLRMEFNNIVRTAGRLVEEGHYREALALYEEFAQAHSDTPAMELAIQAGNILTIQAESRAEKLAKDGRDVLARGDLAAAREAAAQIQAIGLEKTDQIAQALIAAIAESETRAQQEAEEKRRAANIEAVAEFRRQLPPLLEAEKFEEAVTLATAIVENADLAAARAEVRPDLERLRALVRTQQAIRRGAQQTLGPLRDYSPRQLEAFAERGTQRTEAMHQGLAALFAVQNRPDDALDQIRALAEPRLPGWLTALEGDMLFASAAKALDSGQPRLALERLREMKRSHSRTNLYRARTAEIAAMLDRIQRELTSGMIAIPAGAFTFQQNQRVVLPQYLVDRTEVTNAQYAEFLAALATAVDPAAYDHPLQPRSKEDHLPLDWEQNSKGRPDHPVIGVDWFDAYAYSMWADKRLPTEQEWEKAARGTDGRRYPWGQSWKDGMCNAPPAIAGTKEDLPTGVMPAGSFPQGNSPYGVADMAGNVREWAFVEINGPRDNVPTRGGAWSDPASSSAATYRLPIAPTTRDFSTGFRCVMDPITDTP